MPSAFFEKLELRPLAAGRKQISGDVRLDQLPRIRDLLDDADGRIQAVIDFSMRGDGRVVIRSRLDGELPVKCQRCLNAFILSVHTDSELVAVETDTDANALNDESAEPVVVTGGSLRLADLVEEELLLALPIAPKHESKSDCAEFETEYVGPGTDETAGPQTHKPFKDLKDLMH